ncbi:2OG-Fe(II) oxygenase family protein [Babesia ovis]|uniref:2OG-Fe(II) oxygenase family protein n=1 Tax=Babesia ovis TaxID=5869 RepID=A0A9W5WW15_BABOV|nr:2OG-Fe(II) oxygenase family protein [Babesia ovis]
MFSPNEVNTGMNFLQCSQNGLTNQGQDGTVIFSRLILTLDATGHLAGLYVRVEPKNGIGVIEWVNLRKENIASSGSLVSYRGVGVNCKGLFSGGELLHVEPCKQGRCTKGTGNRGKSRAVLLVVGGGGAEPRDGLTRVEVTHVVGVTNLGEQRKALLLDELSQFGCSDAIKHKAVISLVDHVNLLGSIGVHEELGITAVDVSLVLVLIHDLLAAIVTRGHEGDVGTIVDLAGVFDLDNSGTYMEERDTCSVDDYQGLEHVVTVSQDARGYEIKCHKETELILEPIEGGPQKRLSKLYISIEPHVSLILNLLEPDWIRHMIELGDTRWISSKTSTGRVASHPDSYSTQVSKTRRSQSAVFAHAETEIIAQIEHRVSLIAGVDVAYLERLVMVKYSPGDYFKEHHDGAFRSHTVLLYLNDVDGGETVFPELNIAVRPIGNSALYWRNTTDDGQADFRMLHAGVCPKSGTKYVVNCFFNVEPIRDQ